MATHLLTLALAELDRQAIANGYPHCVLVDAAEVYRQVPALGEGALGGLTVPDESIICTWTTNLALATEAHRRGARVLLNHEVTGVSVGGEVTTLATAGGPVHGRWVVNAAGLGADLLDRMFASAQFEGVVDALHPRGELGELVVPEVGLPSTRGHQQRVVPGDRVPAEQPRGDRACGQVDRGDVAQQHGRVPLPREHLTGARGDLPLGEDPGGHLVEQRLEQVVRRPRDQGHLDVGAFERLGTEQSPEARPDDHYSVPAGTLT